MPLRPDNVLQYASGGFNGTSGTVTLPQPTGAAACDVILVAGVGGGTGVSLDPPYPTGIPASTFPRDSVAPTAVTSKAYVWRLSVSPGAGLQSFELATAGGAGPVAWAVFEIENLDIRTPDLVPASYSGSETGGTTRSTQSVQTDVLDGLCLAVHVGTYTSGTTVPTWSGHINSSDAALAPEEAVSQGQAGTGRAIGMSVSWRFLSAAGTMECTATSSLSVVSGATLVIYPATGSRRLPRYDVCFGAEVGTANGLATGAAGTGTSPFDASAGTPAVVTSTPRSGSYCLELSSTAAIENVVWTAAGALGRHTPTSGYYQMVMRLHVRFPGSLPAGDVELAAVEADNGTSLYSLRLWYRSASQKLALQVYLGSDVLSDTTVAADTWIGVDMLHWLDTGTFGEAWGDWQVDYNADDSTGAVAQTRATGTGVPVDFTKVRLGWAAATTATVRYDDIVVAKDARHYPIGNVKIVPLKIDPSASPSVSGTAGNFRVFTSNGGTLSAWDATAARNAVDDVPPTIGASADGVCQITTASGDYMELPLDTYTAAPGYTARALRWYLAGWAASTSAATIGIRGVDSAGANSHQLFAVGDPNFDSSATVWISRMHRIPASNLVTPFTQAMVDSLAARVGFSTDANPDVGVHCVLGELVIAPAAEYEIINIEDGLFTVIVRQDPVTSAVVSYLVTVNDTTRGATFDCTIDGAPITSVYVAAGDSHEQVIGGVSIDSVQFVGLTPDPG